MAVATEGGTDGAAIREGGRGARNANFETGEVLGHSAGEGLGDDAGRDFADAGEGLELATFGAAPELSGIDRGDRFRRFSKGANAVGGLAGTFQKKGDALECFDRVHVGIVGDGGGAEKRGAMIGTDDQGSADAFR